MTPVHDSDHVQRCLDEMKRRDVDLLVLGRESNARYLSGASRLWLSGTRPFGPGCVVVRDTGGVHLLSTTDDLVPLPRDQLFPMSWNPANIVAALAAIPGVAGSRRVGVDGMSPGFAQLLRSVLPDMELVDGEDLLASVRRIKSATDVGAIKAAIRVAEEALRVAFRALVPGVRERGLLGAYAEATGALGVTTPAFEAVFHVVDDTSPSFSTDRVVAAGDLVDASVGVLASGWEGRLARTWPCGEPTKAQRAAPVEWRAALDPFLARVRPGTRGEELRIQETEVRGVGAGDELLDDAQVLEPGMVIALGFRHGGIHGEDTYLVTETGHEVLTTFPDGPA
jgi:Xaa-Pro aminopeptidase